jgi:hypothetical protein
MQNENCTLIADRDDNGTHSDYKSNKKDWAIKRGYYMNLFPKESDL